MAVHSSDARGRIYINRKFASVKVRNERQAAKKAKKQPVNRFSLLEEKDYFDD